MSTERLLEINKQIDEAIPQQAEVAGQIKSEESRTEQQFGIKTISEMKSKLKEVGKEIDREEANFKKEKE